MSDIWILGLNLNHNSSVTLLKNGEVIFFLEEDRLSRVKHDEYLYHTLSKITSYTKKLDYVIVGAENGSNSYNFLCVKGILVKFKLISTNFQITHFVDEHHIFHASSAFYSSGFSEAICLVIDGGGQFKQFERYHNGNECESVYLANYNDGLTPMYKKYMNTYGVDPIYNYKSIHNFVSQPNIACLYSGLTRQLGFCNLDCGKTMGLSAYGQKDNSIPEIFVNIAGEKLLNKNLYNMHLYKDETGQLVEDFNNPNIVGFEKYDKENLCFTIQKATEEYVVEMVNKSLQMSSCKNLVLSGGLFLNVVANYEFIKNIPSDVKVFIDPIAHDGGLSLGAAKWLHHKLFSDKTIRKQKAYYLGPLPEYNYTLNDDEEEIEVDHDYVVKLLEEQNIVALYQGRSEAGPRALGNRSLLFDPRNKNGKDIVNVVKQREWFRPFAGTILKEYADEYFEMCSLEESPFMMYAVKVREGKEKIIPAITHVDNTCRIQTLTKEQNKHYYKLIECFYKKTGVPILLNTSFNLAGDTLVETMDDALRTIRNSDLKYLYLPELGKLIMKK